MKKYRHFQDVCLLLVAALVTFAAVRIFRHPIPLAGQRESQGNHSLDGAAPTGEIQLRLRSLMGEWRKNGLSAIQSADWENDLRALRYADHGSYLRFLNEEGIAGLVAEEDLVFEPSTSTVVLAQAFRETGTAAFHISLAAFDQFLRESTLEDAIRMWRSAPFHLKSTFAKRLFDHWMKENPVGTVQTLLAQRDFPAFFLTRAVAGAVKKDPGQVVELLLDERNFTDPSVKLQQTKLLEEALFGMNTATALDMVGKLEKGALHDRFQEVLVAKALAEGKVVDLPAAGVTAVRVYERVAQELMASDPGKALQIAEKIPSTEKREQVYAKAAAMKGARDPGEVAGWLAGIPDPLNQASATASYLKIVGEKSLATSLRFSSQYLEANSETAAKAIAQVLSRRIANSNPEALKAELKSLNEAASIQLLQNSAKYLSEPERKKMQLSLP